MLRKVFGTNDTDFGMNERQDATRSLGSLLIRWSRTKCNRQPETAVSRPPNENAAVGKPPLLETAGALA
jgi:hypothetical protein